MFQRKRSVLIATLSTTFAVTLLIVLVALSLTVVQAAPLAAKATRTPTPTSTPTTPPLPAGNYYVSINGSDANTGAEASPWRHIQYAVNKVGPGSIVYVMDGVYNETVTFPRSGVSGAYISLQNYPGHA